MWDVLAYSELGINYIPSSSELSLNTQTFTQVSGVGCWLIQILYTLYQGWRSRGDGGIFLKRSRKEGKKEREREKRRNKRKEDNKRIFVPMFSAISTHRL